MVVVLETNLDGKIRTKAFVRAYDSDIEIELFENEPLSIKRAQRNIRFNIIDTAIVKAVEWHLKEGVVYVANEEYLKSQSYLKIKKETHNGDESKKG
jgi:hypothetical protein